MDSESNTQNQYSRTLHTYSFIQNDIDNLESIKRLCNEQIKKFNFDYFSYVGYYPISEETHEISTFPDEWSQENKLLYGFWDNPIAKFSQNRNTPFLWKDSIAMSNNNTANLADFLALAQKYSIHDGVCFPVHGAGAEWGMFNIARRINQKFDSHDCIEAFQLYALTVHEAMKRAMNNNTNGHTKQKKLSPRECECLNWIAAGKTAWETAKIIGITESTVSFHVRNTIVKLNAKNRAQAVAVAMARSLIDNPRRYS